MRKRNYIDKTIVMEDILDKRKFIIPQFQRRLVWTKKKKEEFIRNLLEGDPFGVLLIRVTEDGRYELNDGLQRITTIQDFNEHPFEYVDSKDINKDKVEELIKAHLKSKDLPVTEEYIKNNREKWQKKIFDSIKAGGKESGIFEVIYELKEEFDLSNDKDVYNIINDIFKEFMDFIDLDNLQINAINYIGPEENIQKVFYNLNTGGVKLSPYDTYSALWYDNKFKVEDEDLIELVANWYKELEKDSEMEVDVTKETLTDEGITIYEYSIALGVIMRNKKEKFDILFTPNTKPIDPLGFEILALLLTDKYNNAKGMYESLSEVSPSFLVELKDIMNESLIQITKSLKELLLGKNQSYLYSDNTFLIYHIIVSYIKQYYDIDPKTNTIQKKDSTLNKEDFEKYAPLHYLMDCITEYWKENRQVTDLQNAVRDKDDREKYWYNIPPEDWRAAVKKFMSSQKLIGSKITQPNKLFIDYLTKLRIRENRDYDKCFSKENVENEEYPLDIEHIMPKKVIQDHIADLSESQKQVIPVSAIGNLCYLTAKDNRAKGHKTLYDYLEGRPAFYTKQPFLDCVLYPSKDDLKFKDYNNEQFLERYDKFIDKRQAKLQEEFLRLINKFY